MLALNNVYCAHLNPATAVLGAAHGSYGIGGTVTPIIATLMVSRGMDGYSEATKNILLKPSSQLWSKLPAGRLLRKRQTQSYRT